MSSPRNDSNAGKGKGGNRAPFSHIAAVHIIELRSANLRRIAPADRLPNQILIFLFQLIVRISVHVSPRSFIAGHFL
jgi:hypothetical protein